VPRTAAEFKYPDVPAPRPTKQPPPPRTVETTKPKPTQPPPSQLPLIRQPLKPTFDGDIDSAFSALHASDTHALDADQQKKAALEASLQSYIATSRVRSRSKGRTSRKFADVNVTQIQVEALDIPESTTLLLPPDAAVGTGMEEEGSGVVRKRRGRSFERAKVLTAAALGVAAEESSKAA
jgi:hypothetical protein